MKGWARDWWILIGLWVVFSLIGEALVPIIINNYPAVAAVEGEVSDEAIFFLLPLVIPIAVLVVLLLVYSATQFRARPGETGDAPVQRRSHPLLSWGWLLISAALTIFVVFDPGIIGLREIWASAEAEDPLVVNAIASQWQWNYEYPQYDLELEDESPELVIPLGRTVKFVVTSKDVNHAFWIPSFRLKTDAIPGQARILYLTPNELTSTEENPMTRVQCAELCGVGHARMRTAVRVVTEEEFEAWLAEEGAPANMNMGQQNQDMEQMNIPSTNLNGAEVGQ